MPAILLCIMVIRFPFEVQAGILSDPEASDFTKP
jgi:hypothetical protein